MKYNFSIRNSVISFCALVFLWQTAVVDAQEGQDRQESGSDTPAEIFYLPPTMAIDIARNANNLPGDLRGKWNIVAFAYERKHQKESEKWGEYFTETIGSTGTPYYSILLIDDVPKWVQRLIMNGINIDLQEESWRFLIIFEDRKPIVEAYKLQQRKEVIVLLVGQDGTTYVLADKPFGDEAIEQFQENLTRYEDLLFQ